MELSPRRRAARPEGVFSGAAEQVSSLSALQRRMDSYPQLSQEAQLELVARLRRASAAASRPPRTPAERASVVAARREVELCLEHLVAANFRLVQLIAREKAQERYGPARAFEMIPDLVAEGMSALTEAALSYDPATCPTFTKYAQSAVRNHIRAAIANSGPLRVTSSVARMKRIATKRRETLTEQLGRPPTTRELQDELLLWCLSWAEGRLSPEEAALGPEERHEVKMAKLRKQGMLSAIENVEEVLAYSQTVTSLSSPVGDGTGTVGDLVPDRQPDTMFDGAEISDLNERLRRALATLLTEREQRVVSLRFGLEGGESWTYARIAPLFGLTAERIRQVERAALTKLAQDPSLAAFLPNLDEG